VRLLFLAAILAFTFSVTSIQADDVEKKEIEFAAPLPSPVKPQLLPYYLPSSLPKPGTREVWQYYGVDGRGRWVPRVILTPSGSAYYYYNGRPFYYTTTQPKLYMQYVVD